MNLMLLLVFAVLVAILCQNRRIEHPTRAQKWILSGTTVVAGALVAFGGVV